MLKMFKKISFVFIFLFLTLCNFKVYAAEITALEYNGFSDNRWATVHFATPTKDGGIVSISPVGPKEYGLNVTNSSYVNALVKLNSNSEVEWGYPLNNYDLSFTDILVDDDTIMVVGSEIDWGLYYNNYNAKILVFDFDGKFIEEIDFKFDTPSLKIDSLIYDGEYYYGVGLNDETELLDEDAQYYYTRKTTDYGLFKIDSNFNVVWFEKIDTKVIERTYQKNSGSAYVSAMGRDSYIDFTPDGNIVFSYNYKDNNSIKVYKYDKSGKQLFKTDLGGSEFSSTWDSDLVLSLVSTDDNGVIVGGYLESLDVIDLAGNSDAFYMKLDKSGNVEWIKYLSGTGYDSIKGISRYNDDYVMVGATSVPFEGYDDKGSFMAIINDSGETLASLKISDDLEFSYFYEPLSVLDSKIFVSGYASNSYTHYTDVVERINAIVTYSVKYDITVKEESVTSFEVQEDAYAGDVVEFSIKLEEGYIFKGIKDIELTTIGENIYSFVMPAKDIELVPIIEKEEVQDNTNNEVNKDEEKEDKKNPDTSDIKVIMILFTILCGVGLSFMNYRKLKWLK